LKPGRHLHPSRTLATPDVELAGHARHPAAPAALYVPAKQFSHALAPPVPLNVPGRQA
jgi:hypothetical protein